SGRAPNLRRLNGDAPYHISALSTAPSITFAAQASIVTGAHPASHWMSGNQLFDRFGTLTGGKPRFYGFDVGDTMEYEDAVGVFANNLADRMLNPDVPTLYDTAAHHGKHSMVIYHEYGRGAQQVIRPSVLSMA